MDNTNSGLKGYLIRPSTMIVVSDLNRSVAYYQHHFDFDVREHEPYIALLSLGEMHLYLVTESPPTPDKPSVTLKNLNTPDATGINLIFRVSNCRAIFNELSQRGLEFLAPPASPPWGGWRCFTRDPDGHLIEIEEA